jgi:hypothetical protein
MNTRLLAGLLVICLTCSVRATERGQFATAVSLEPELGYAFGSTEYQIALTGLDNSGNLLSIRSKLVFPLDGLVGGARLRLSRVLDPRHRLAASIGVSVPITDPSVRMTDEDWERTYPGPEIKVGFTQSTAKVTGVQITAEGSYGFDYPTGPSYDVVFGLRYQRSVQDMYDYSGWYADSIGRIDSVSGNVHALYYRVTFVTASIGFRITAGQADRVQFRFEGAFAPTHMSDYDNHLLRKKDSRASAWGIGGLGSAGVRINLRHRSRGISYLDLSGSVFYTKATMTQTQRWYGDDPATPGVDDTGLIFAGIPYSIKTLQFGLNARLGFAL